QSALCTTTCHGVEAYRPPRCGFASTTSHRTQAISCASRIPSDINQVPPSAVPRKNSRLTMVACRSEGFFLRRRRAMVRLLVILNGPGQTPEVAGTVINLGV